MKSSTLFIVLAWLFGILSITSIGFYRYFSSKENSTARKESTDSIKTSIHDGNDELKLNIKQDGKDTRSRIDSTYIEFTKQSEENTANILKQIEKSRIEHQNKRNQENTEPYIGISSDGIGPTNKFNDGKIHYELKLDPILIPTTNYKINSFIVFEMLINEQTKFFKHISDILAFDKSTTIPAHKGRSNRSIAYVEPGSQVINLYVYFSGSYTNLSGSSTYNVDKLYCFNEKKNMTMEIVGAKKTELLAKFNSLK